MMTLLGLSLAIGLLIDDAVVVRENIFKFLEKGESPMQAAIKGTQEVQLAVLATTLTIVAVFVPVAFMDGMVGQFFKQFGLTVCFAMLISLFDGLFVAPAMSAYMGGGGHNSTTQHQGKLARWNRSMLQKFDSFQTWMEAQYVKILNLALNKPWKTLVASLLIFISSLVIARFVPFTFLPPQDNGERCGGV
jgi:multidrug efflux pump subunit AcrB